LAVSLTSMGLVDALEVPGGVHGAGDQEALALIAGL
jgi:hypothetical protein